MWRLMCGEGHRVREWSVLAGHAARTVVLNVAVKYGIVSLE